MNIDRYEPILTIGTVAEKLGVAVQTVRLYEHEGLLISYKTKSGRRMYSLNDLDRLICIRQMITEEGLNISGIKHLMSLIPCWELKGGLDEDCKNCPVYYQSNEPCWSSEKVGKKCIDADCRSCSVYKIDMHCNKLKEVIYGHKTTIEADL